MHFHGVFLCTKNRTCFIHNAMRSTTKLNSGILSLLQLMGEKYPELLRNMDETPVTFAASAAVQTEHFELQHYYNALRAIYSGYDQEHLQKKGGIAGCE